MHTTKKIKQDSQVYYENLVKPLQKPHFSVISARKRTDTVPAVSAAVLPEHAKGRGRIDRVRERDGAYFSASAARNFQHRAASTPPTMGASRKTQTLARDLPPMSRAGPKERAGFTEVPVK